MIIAEKFHRRVFANAKRSGGKNTNRARRDVVEFGGRVQELRAGHANISDRSIFHRRFNEPSQFYELAVVRQFQCFGSIADTERLAILLSWWSVRQHSDLLCRKRAIQANKRLSLANEKHKTWTVFRTRSKSSPQHQMAPPDGLPASGGKHLRVQGVGDIKIKLHRPVSSKIKTVSVKRAGNPLVGMLLMPSLGTAVAREHQPNRR